MSASCWSASLVPRSRARDVHGGFRVGTGIMRLRPQRAPLLSFCRVSFSLRPRPFCVEYLVELVFGHRSFRSRSPWSSEFCSGPGAMLFLYGSGGASFRWVLSALEKKAWPPVDDARGAWRGAQLSRVAGATEGLLPHSRFFRRFSSNDRSFDSELLHCCSFFLFLAASVISSLFLRAFYLLCSATPLGCDHRRRCRYKVFRGQPLFVGS